MATDAQRIEQLETEVFGGARRGRSSDERMAQLERAVDGLQTSVDQANESLTILRNHMLELHESLRKLGAPKAPKAPKKVPNGADSEKPTQQ
jgi:hypothetical protein